MPTEAPEALSVFWMYAIRVEGAFGCSRDELRAALAERGIETRCFFVPIHFQPIYFGQFRGERFPIAEELCRTGLYLPTSPSLEASDVDWISDQVVDIHRRMTARVCAAQP